MAIYRSDQAQFTFAAEAGKGGGPPEAATGTAATADTALAAVALPGATSITVDAVTNLEASHTADSDVDERYMIIDYGATTGTSASNQNGTSNWSVPEIRRVTRIDGSTIVHFTPPLAFPHGIDAKVRAYDHDGGIAVTDGESGVNDKMITWFPGVYDSVDCPDPDEAFDQRYVLGQNTKRNVYQFFKGQQTYSGAVAGMVLLNGFPLRFPIGKVISVPASVTQNNITNLEIASNRGLQITAGSVMAKVIAHSSPVATHLANGSIVVLGGDNSGFVTASSVPNSSCRQEVRRIVSGGSSSVANGTYVRLNYPVFFDHDPLTPTTIDNRVVETGRTGVIGTSIVFKHHLVEDVQLSSLSWNVAVKDDAGENLFQRRYYGGKVDGMTLTAEAGGLITCDWDTVNFLGMAHNQQKSSATSPVILDASEDVRGFNFMHEINADDIGTPTSGTGASDVRSLPTTEPYYFSEGEVSLFGSAIGRVQTFSLTIGNATEPKYYLEHRGGDNRGPVEIFEGQRSYSMTATIGLPDSEASTGTTHNLFKELLQAGDHPTAGSSGNFTNLEGVQIKLLFQRAGNSADQIQIDVPGANSSTGVTQTLAEGGNNQGAMLSAAPINVDGANPMEQSANFMIRNMKITISDEEQFYP